MSTDDTDDLYSPNSKKDLMLIFHEKKKYLAHFEFDDCNTSQKVEILFTTV